MASFEQLKELFLNQEEKDSKRREKEKEEEERKRKEDKEEVKQLIKSQMSTIKEDINEIKVKQKTIEDKVKEAEDKMAKKYVDLATKLGGLEKKIKEIEVREKAEEKESDKTFSAFQPRGRTCLVPQPRQPVLHPVGRQQTSSQPAEQVYLQPDKEVYRIVREARKTVGFSPISNSDIKEVMSEKKIKDMKEGMEEAIKDFFRWEMAIPEEELSRIQFARIFRREGDTKTNNDKLYVEFVEESMATRVYKYVRKMRSHCKILTFIPGAFRERGEELEKVAYSLRHSNPSHKTRIRWGWGDLILEKKKRGSREQYRSVNVTHLPPVNLMATSRQKLTNQTSSPAPGRKMHFQESPNLPIRIFIRPRQRKQRFQPQPQQY